MKLTYKPLWKLMIDMELSNGDVIEMAGISKSTFYKLKKDESVNLDIILRICKALDCDVKDVVACEREKMNRVVREGEDHASDVVEYIEDES